MPTLVYLLMANETVPTLATTRQSHSNAMTSTVWLEMKVWPAMTECGVQSYLNAKVIANLKIARLRNKATNTRKTLLRTWKTFDIHVSKLFSMRFWWNLCLKILLTQRRVPTLAYLRMANETVPILAMRRQSHSSAMTSTVWLEMKVWAAMTECGVQSYPNAKVRANLKIARYLKQSP